MTTPRTIIITAASMAEGGHLPLYLWLSPAFPVGAFAYSHGLEWAVENGDIGGAADLEAWISDIVAYGSGRADAILLSLAHRAVLDEDLPALREARDYALALSPGAERRLETVTQGNAFLATIRAAWPSPALAPCLDLLGEADCPYPLAVGAVAAAHRVSLDEALPAFLLAFAGNLVSAAVRLSLIGQTDGQRVLASLMPVIRETAGAVRDLDLDDIATSCLAADLASLRHETQYSRLFRS